MFINFLSFYFMLLIFSTFFSSFFFLFNFTTSLKNIYNNNFVLNLFKYLHLFFFIIGFIWFFFIFYCYLIDCMFLNDLDILRNYKLVKSNFKIFFLPTYYHLNFFSCIIIFLAYFTGFLSFIILNDKFVFYNNFHIVFFNYFIIIVFCFVTTNNIFNFFIFYELLLLPSFLLVFFNTSNRKGVYSSLIFLFWTQIGSLLMLFFLMFFFKTNIFWNYFNIFSENSLNSNYHFFNFSQNFLLLFFSFGFKIPIWPLYYWLIKTHVEASSGFSIYLSGFLVKAAIFGFFKLSALLSINYIPFIINIFIFFGIIDSSIKFFFQNDLKKLIAYGTVQEMNMIYMCVIFGDTKLNKLLIIFLIMHSIISSLFFF